MSFFKTRNQELLFDPKPRAAVEQQTQHTPQTLAVHPYNPFQALTYNQHGNSGLNTFFDGDKFAGGFGTTKLFEMDYWTLRKRSAQLFTENLYARGLVRRLVTNVVNVGLGLEAMPDDNILPESEDSLRTLSDVIESRFSIWGKNELMFDYKQQFGFGEMQGQLEQEALIEGDVLVIQRQSRTTNRPTIQLIGGSKVITPMKNPRSGNIIKHGVELDSRGVQVAYWVEQKDKTVNRMPAYGERSGRRIAWLYYGTDKRMDDVRGTPLLSLILQSIKELDRYRDSAQRKAVINSILAMFIKKDADLMGSLPVTGGAQRVDHEERIDSDGTTRNFNIAQQTPGVVMEELQKGETPVGFHSQGTDVNFPDFEKAILAAIAWANEVPPEILILQFGSNYSASQAASNEFKIFLNKSRSKLAAKFCQPIYESWLISEALTGDLIMPGFIESWNNPGQYATYGAWVTGDWAGAIKPAVDIVKQTNGYVNQIDNNLITRARSAKELNGMKFDKIVKILKRENEQVAEASRPLLELEKEFGAEAVAKAKANITKKAEDLSGQETS